MANLSILGPDGRCFTFDERANGYGRGEGVGVVGLMRVEEALRDNDTIRAVIRATRSNQDGHTQGEEQGCARRRAKQAPVYLTARQVSLSRAWSDRSTIRRPHMRQ